MELTESTKTQSNKLQPSKVTLVCNECGKKRKVSADGQYNDRCPRCGGVDWDVTVPSSAAIKAAHTPGPWRAEMHEIGDDERWFIEFDGSFIRNSTIASLNSDCVAYSNAAADARLIAAAPEMLEALEAFVALANFDADTIPKTNEEWDAMVAKGEAAIQKARGLR